MTSTDAIRAAFADQAEYCRRLGSPFTALLCDTVGRGLSTASDAGRLILEWPGDPAPLADSLPLRVAGALHSMARSGAAPRLSALYPPSQAPDPATLLATIEQTLAAHSTRIGAFIRSHPQTNEVGRAAALLPGWLEIARRTGLPLALYEIGASAGLNLVADRYRFRFGDARWGDPASSFVIQPEWSGPPPPVDAPLAIASRRGCDLNPIALHDVEERERLMAYIWADQAARLQRVAAAIERAATAPPPIDRADAADWVESCLPEGSGSGTARVLYHSIVWMYLPPPIQRRITGHMQRIGAAATSSTPVAWLRFEGVPTELRLTLWPGGEDVVLADTDPHGTKITWRSGEPTHGSDSR